MSHQMPRTTLPEEFSACRMKSGQLGFQDVNFSFTATASLLQLALISSLHCISENTSFSTGTNKVSVESRSTLCIVGSRTPCGIKGRVLWSNSISKHCIDLFKSHSFSNYFIAMTMSLQTGMVRLSFAPTRSQCLSIQNTCLVRCAGQSRSRGTGISALASIKRHHTTDTQVSQKSSWTHPM
jgi:hypothetical protein